MTTLSRLCLQTLRFEKNKLLRGGRHLKNLASISAMPIKLPCWRANDVFTARICTPELHVSGRRRYSATSQPSSKSPTVQEHASHHSILTSLRRLENSLRFHGYSTLRIGVALCIVAGATVYLMWEPIRENVAVEVSQVASRSLGHEEVVGKAEEFTRSLLNTLLNDENMHSLAAQFVKEVLNSPETRRASIEYITRVLEDPHTRQFLASTIKEVLLLAINDPETRAALKAAVVLILSDPASQKAARDLILAVFQHEKLKKVAAEFFGDVLKSQVVITQATQLGKNVTYNVITDPKLKEETGKSFWQAMKYSITPRWLSGSPSTEVTDDSTEEPSPQQASEDPSVTVDSLPSEPQTSPSSESSPTSLTDASSLSQSEPTSADEETVLAHSAQREQPEDKTDECIDEDANILT
ncbi:uncharacterized protein [Diadema antillarum]|uniref:uncharacterized protein n=1 Tax=Diadema antillarum TaxID=105358 RepID=UPI003A89DC95